MDGGWVSKKSLFVSRDGFLKETKIFDYVYVSDYVTVLIIMYVDLFSLHAVKKISSGMFD